MGGRNTAARSARVQCDRDGQRPFHKRQDTLDTLQAEGHTVLWLLPYSPDFNPIEKMWAWIKRLRKQWQLADVNALLF